jgi:hypothetical protein
MKEREAVSWNRLEREKMRRRSLCIPWRYYMENTA